MLGSVCFGLCNAYAQNHCCEAMHACSCLCVLMHNAHAPSAIAARQCMHVLECV